MKFLFSQLVALLYERSARENIFFLARFVGFLVFIIAAYSSIFHYLMDLEGKEYSWITGLYWTLTVMSTLGFGDITFTSDAGKLFSIIVLLSGVIFFLVMLPFTFIQYFYAPWLELQKKRRIPRTLPAMQGHIIIVGINPLSLNLADELKAYGIRCVLLSPDNQTTLNLVSQGYTTMMGDHDSGETYRKLHIDGAAMVVAMDSDVRNTNIVFSAREVNPDIRIVSKVEQEAAVDILELAGANKVFQFHTLLGNAIARRVLHAGHRTSVLNRFEQLEVVEAPLMRTRLVGKSLRHSGLRDQSGINVVGIWERGQFSIPSPDTVFSANTVIVAAGTAEQIESLEVVLGAGNPPPKGSDSAVILGGGRVGLAAVKYLKRHGHECVVVEKGTHLTRHKDITHVHGDAAELEVLEKAGLRDAPSVLITTHDDDTNIYLTIYCRRLRPDIQIISRATFDRNVGILHAAGADLVLSLASMITSNVINMLSPGKVAMLNEGLNLFRCSVGENLAGKRLLESGIRDNTNCTVVAVRPAEGGDLLVNPDPDYTFKLGDKFYLIGDSAGEARSYELYGQDADAACTDDTACNTTSPPPSPLFWG